MLMPVVPAASKGLSVSMNLLQLGPCSWPVQVSETISKPMIHAVTDCKERISYSSSDTNDDGCTVEKEGHGRLM